MTPGASAPPRFTAAPVRVRVPATSANLGPGFDACGLALALHDDLVAEVTPGGLSVQVVGEGAGDVPTDGRHLVVRAMRVAFDALGGQPPGLALRCTNVIPHGRGLGSSAAAIVGGMLAARALVVDGAERLDDQAVLRLAATMEGHPDNVAACLLGGYTVAWTTAEGARAVRGEVAPDVVPVVFVPSTEVPTSVARGLLPASVPFADAVLVAGRAALLTAALATPGTAGGGVLLAATEDRLHQQYRAGVMPGSAALIDRLRADGVAAVVSGAGPTVLALCDAATAAVVAAAPPADFVALVLAVDAGGAVTGPA